MASVFLSYDHEDEEHALSIMSALEKAGHVVWWDRHISGGAQYNSEIENAVSNADAVVVLWSERAVQSAWVRDEAAEGRDGGKLVPVKLHSELAEAERLWPGASTIIDARYRLDLRYGSVAEAADALALMQSGKVKTDRTRDAFVRARLNRTPANIDRAVNVALSAYATQPEIDTTSEVIFTLGEFDRTKELLNFLLAWTDRSQIPYFVENLFRPPLADIRADPRFMQVADRFRLLDYWRRSGNWPDFCSDPELPYDCKQEATRLGR